MKVTVSAPLQGLCLYPSSEPKSVSLGLYSTPRWGLSVKLRHYLQTITLSVLYLRPRFGQSESACEIGCRENESERYPGSQPKEDYR